jgi:hypothetical protein
MFVCDEAGRPQSCMAILNQNLVLQTQWMILTMNVRYIIANYYTLLRLEEYDDFARLASRRIAGG